MKICVLNGSPKGNDSVTMQYVRFLELANPTHTFVVENIGSRISVLETKDEDFKKVIDHISSSDAVLFATPVYYMLVPAQFKRFFELLLSRNCSSAFDGKYAASITTSIHFFDHTANAYLHAIAEDLGMHWAGSFMAKMDDLLEVKHQEDLVRFGSDFFETAAGKPELQRFYPPVNTKTNHYHPGPIPLPFDAKGKSVVILSDAVPGSNLEKMVTRLASCFGTAASIVPLDEAGMKGGCLGCCRCAFENRCVYTDGFSGFWKETVLAADILIIAGTVKDRYLSAEFKQIFDRSFFLGHVPVLAGKPVGFLFGGPFSQCETLRDLMTTYVANQGATLAGIVTDEEDNSALTDARIDALADRALRLAQSGYVPPAGFPTIAGQKIFRDEIWSEMRAIFQADHAYYKKHGFYDFPQNDYARRIRTTFLSLLMHLPQARKSAELEMKKHMIEPFAQVFSSSPVLKRRQQARKE